MHLTHLTINPIDYNRRIINQASTAVNDNLLVLIICLGRRGELKYQTTSFGCVRRIISPFPKGGPLKFIHFNFRLFLLLLPERTDILHAHDLWVLPAAALISLIKRNRLIYDAHEYYAGLEVFNRHPLRGRLWMIVEKLLIRYVTVMFTVSEPLARKYRERYPNIRDCKVIRNLPVWEKPSKEKAAPFPRPFTNMLVYHGHLQPGRGLENLIRAMTPLEDTGLVIIGTGELLGKLVALIDQHQVQAKVLIKDYIDMESLISTSAQADIGVVLFEKTSVNYSHALPNKFFENIMAGLPVLTSDIDTLSGYVQKYNLGRTVDPSDPDLIAKTIREMTGNPEALQTWRSNAYSAARELNWDLEAEKMRKIYEKLAY